MKTIEDALTLLFQCAYDSRVSLSQWDQDFLTSVYTSRVVNHKPITTGQATLAIKILRKNKSFFSDENSGIDLLLDNPVYRHSPQESLIIPREIRHVEGNIFAFRFKFSPEIVSYIKMLRDYAKSRGFYQSYDKEWRINLIEIGDSQALDNLFSFIKKYKFHVDDESLQVLTDLANQKENQSMIEIKDGQLFLNTIRYPDLYEIAKLMAQHVD